MTTYATHSLIEHAGRIRAAARRGTPAAELAAAADLDVALVDRMLLCRTKEAAAKMLAESVSSSQQESPTQQPASKALRSYLRTKTLRS